MLLPKGTVSQDPCYQYKRETWKPNHRITPQICSSLKGQYQGYQYIRETGKPNYGIAPQICSFLKGQSHKLWLLVHTRDRETQSQNYTSGRQLLIGTVSQDQGYQYI
jgi:hypothetical protein